MAQGVSSAPLRLVVLAVLLAAAVGCAGAERPRARDPGHGERLMRVLVEEGLNRNDPEVLARIVAGEFTLHVRGLTNGWRLRGLTDTPEKPGAAIRSIGR